MKKIVPALASSALAALFSLAPPAFAQGMDHGRMGSGAMMGMQQNHPLVEGEVRRVDKENGKITLRHGEIKNMDMPPMTMVFVVRDKAMLDGIAVGDKVQFTAVQDKGQMVVESIKPLKP
ncbi:copper-binding protein [Hydrogenophaga sp. YM1]|uniref:copper-binding protein n=1 Tax=Hydrogenophaga sp. YM1 TaxID=2806262 RepID=UPI001957C19F|nr:copper-binding protein [Hydrogenophaga sp. YM1]QRR32408.1 copper-binding protein [Hydrogenophaga sp. YM1]